MRRLSPFWSGGLLVATGLSMILVGALPGRGQPQASAPPPELIRFHVIAHSDAAADQAAKLAVRDAVLPLVQAVVAGAQDLTGLEAALTSALPALTEQAGQVLQARELDYPVRAELGNFIFDQRVYGDQVFPAGEYQALRLVLGEGAGQNWWCVLFPSICTTQATRSEFTGATGVAAGAAARPARPGPAIVLNERGAAELPVVPRLALVRWWQRLFGNP